MDTREKIQAAKIKAMLDAPYLSHAIWRLRGPIFTESLPAAAAVSDNWILYVNEKYLEAFDPAQASFIIQHEVWHLLSLHARRFKVSEPLEIQQRERAKIWNIAADCCINEMLKRDGSRHSNVLCFPSSFGLAQGQQTETYYEELLKRGEGDKKVQSFISLGEGSGSSSDGQRRDYEGGGDGSDGGEDEKDMVGSPLSEIEKELIAKEVAREILNHSKRAGTIPAEALRWAEQTLAPPKLPWQKVLAQKIRGAIGYASGLDDYSYNRPSRRQASLPEFIFPNLVRPQIEAAIVLDTSGSMSQRELEIALPEIDGILRATGSGTATVLSVDAAVHNKQKVSSARQVRAKGGGGTDMGVGLKAAEKAKPKPDVTVVLTDGFTPWPRSKPRCGEVVVCLIGDYTSSEGIPRWVHGVVKVESSKGRR